MSGVSRAFARRAFVGLALAASAACTLFNPLEEYGVGSARDAAAPESGDPDARACAPSRWPSRPATEDGSGDIELVQALRTFSADPTTDAGGPPGYDLDGVCTCPEPESCAARPGAPQPRCDGPGGVDNAGGDLLTTIAQLADRNADTNARLRSGDYGMLIRVRRYNGGANDREVEVAMFLSNGTDGIQDGGVPPTPAYDGNDRWTVEPRSLAGGAGPPYIPIHVDTNAYVAGNVLVATVNFPLRLGRMAIELSGSVVTGTLVEDGTGYRIDDGVIAGRGSTRSLLTNLATIDDPFRKGGHLCGDSGTYADVKRAVCSRTDIVGDVKQDNTSAPCDALAVAAHFTTSSAQLGTVFAPPPLPSSCGPQWVDDCSN